MRAYPFIAAAVLLAIPSVTLGQSFAPDAPPATHLTISVRFAAAALPVAAVRSQGPAVPVRLDLSTLELLRAVQENPGPCGRAQLQARAEADAMGRYVADDWFGMSAKSQRNWEVLAEIVGGFLMEENVRTGLPVPRSVAGCPPAKPRR